MGEKTISISLRSTRDSIPFDSIPESTDDIRLKTVIDCNNDVRQQ